MNIIHFYRFQFSLIIFSTDLNFSWKRLIFIKKWVVLSLLLGSIRITFIKQSTLLVFSNIFAGQFKWLMNVINIQWTFSGCVESIISFLIPFSLGNFLEFQEAYHIFGFFHQKINQSSYGPQPLALLRISTWYCARLSFRG